MKRVSLTACVAAAVAVAIIPSVGHGQGIRDRLRQGARAVSDALRNAVKCMASDTQCIQNAQAQGKHVTVVDSTGHNVSTADSARAIQNAQAASASAPASNASSSAPAAAASEAAPSAPPGQGAWLNYDFVPGDRVLWWEDFSGDAVGDFPRRMQLREGNFEVVNVGGHKYLRTAEGGHVFIVLPDTLPRQFTVEVKYYGPESGNPISFWTSESSDFARWGCYRASAWVDAGGGGASSGANAHGIGEHDFVNCRFTISDRYIKAYINEQRTANVPTTHVAHTDTLYIQVPSTGDPDNATLFTDLRIAAGGRRLYDALSANGRVATQGILFDTGSDHIRGESTPTLKEIGDMLTEHADLKLTIEGHTDNVGSAATNQSLSERRAAAVKQYLIDTFHIDASRLNSVGFGSTHPAAPNTTPEGRQTNRRVELVRM